ncbi:MAG: AzlC family ABC transporter permease [Actinomycetota bacterium]
MTLTTTPPPSGAPPIVDRSSIDAGPSAPPAPIALGARDVAPLAASVVPFGLAIGATIAESGLASIPALSGSVILLAGASHLAIINVLAVGGGIAVAVATALLINARLVLYSAALARWFGDAPRWRRLVLAMPIVDQTFAICQRRFDTTDTTVGWRERYYVSATAVIATCYVVSMLVGFGVGAELPSGLGLHLAAPLAFAGLVASATTARSTMVAAVTAAVIAVVFAALPAGLALPIGVIAGLIAGSLVASQVGPASGADDEERS